MGGSPGAPRAVDAHGTGLAARMARSPGCTVPSRPGARTPTSRRADTNQPDARSRAARVPGRQPAGAAAVSLGGDAARRPPAAAARTRSVLPDHADAPCSPALQRRCVRPGRGRAAVTGAFIAVFAVFVVLMAAVAFLAVRWAVRRDRAERRRRAEAATAGRAGDEPPGGPGRRT